MEGQNGRVKNVQRPGRGDEGRGSVEVGQTKCTKARVVQRVGQVHWIHEDRQGDGSERSRSAEHASRQLQQNVGADLQKTAGAHPKVAKDMDRVTLAIMQEGRTVEEHDDRTRR